MDAFVDSDLMTLARHRGPWCISVYLPTDRSANGMLQNPIRLKNLANQAEAMLVDHGLRAPEARKALKPLADLLARKEFFKEVSSGLAVFIDAEGARTYRLPHTFPELVFVGRRFHVKPLLPLSGSKGKFFLLAASRNALRMYAGDRGGLSELDVPGLPRNMSEALNYDQPEEVRQVHTATAGGRYGTQMSFHGQGGHADAVKGEVLEFLRIVDRALAKYLATQRAPLVFAGVEYLYPIFEKTCSYSNRLAEHIRANTDKWNKDQLHAAAWAIVEPLSRLDRDEAVARSRRMAGTDHALLQLDRVLQACRLGQVDTLLVDPGQSRWGTFDAVAGTVHLDETTKPGNEDLLDLAVVLALQNGGKVWPAHSDELPDHNPVTALLRYPSTATPIPQTPGRATRKKAILKDEQ
jgi:hypothetical protein